ncbi:glutamate ABC transporter substrate-binding protein [Streptomyces alkaliterrae]|uniref:Glutamate ABC transporter substrate-binding protein n=1 Tax=Streptomyces alkaliterrae TaxID=2213162 RepID=A0A5P0YZN4_9ACTN|nr:glutamate ABC transporter substrate-binding protein [Streptomyces alkaliterrae]MBB1253032.1 glutamate ABC transporter substrate-binding protein [Streptomyces alkaliterrae]MBB1258601.1 glutamate ABC transporter substrate-binding protein [Streptomyces alkaliterrae]MQS04129.1 transporter substrate-binding domain-containing protein [Streptomyces alkaliterrae]
MRLRQYSVVAAVATVLALTAACGTKKNPNSADENAPDLPTYKVAENVDIDSAVLKAAQKRGKLVIGSKSDQPYLGFQDPGSKKYQGFDVEIAKMIAADLGFDPEKDIEWKTIDSSIRETAVSKGQVDLMIGTYTINDERKKQIDFAGPYYMAGQDLLVRKDDKDIKGPDSIKGKTVCSIKGSTPLRNITENKAKYGAKTVELGKYTDCVKQLIDGQVDAMTTDDAILKGYAAQQPAKLRVVGETFSDEPYGVGVKKGDKALRDAVSDAIQAHIDNGDYKKAYEATLGLSGSEYVDPPKLDRY